MYLQCFYYNTSCQTSHLCRTWSLGFALKCPYTDVIMGEMASQITSLTTVYSTIYSDADQRKYQSSASLAFVRGIQRRPVNSPHKWPVTRKMFPFDDVSMVLAFTDSTTSAGKSLTTTFGIFTSMSVDYQLFWIQFSDLIPYSKWVIKTMLFCNRTRVNYKSIIHLCMTIIIPNRINSLRSSHAFMYQWTGALMDQARDNYLKQWWIIVHWEKTSVKFESNFKSLFSWKCIWRCHLPNGGYFVQTSRC